MFLDLLTHMLGCGFSSSGDMVSSGLPAHMFRFPLALSQKLQWYIPAKELPSRALWLPELLAPNLELKIAATQGSELVLFPIDSPSKLCLRTAWEALESATWCPSHGTHLESVATVN